MSVCMLLGLVVDIGFQNFQKPKCVSGHSEKLWFKIKSLVILGNLDTF